MNWNLYIVPFVLMFGSAGTDAAVKAGNMMDRSQEVWIARVGGYPIFLDDYVRRYTDFIIANGMRDNLAVRKAILENMINEELLQYFDSKTEVLHNSDYLNDIERARKRTVLAYLKDRDIYAAIEVNDHDVRQAFLRANEKLAASHLYARTEEEANALYQLLTSGVDFSSLAKQVFTDSVLQGNGGYLGYFSWGDMDPAFEEAAYSLAVGEVSLPVKTAQGYSIIRLEDRVAHPLLTETQFLKKKSHLVRVLKIRKKKSVEEEYVRRVFKRNEVVFDDDALMGVFDELRSFKAKDAESRRPSDASAVCAAYEGVEYRRNDILRRLRGLPGHLVGQVTSLEKLKATVTGFFLQEKLLAVAREKGYDTLSVVADAYEKTREALFLKHKIREITGKTQLPESMIAEYYSSHPAEFSNEDEMNIQEIIVADKGLADSLKNVIQNGVDFGEMAERYSLRKWSAGNKGVMGFAPLSRFGHFKGMLWESQTGTVVGPMAVGDCFCLFKVLEKKKGQPIPLSLIRDRVEWTLKFEKQRSIVKDYLDALGKKVKIEIDEQRLRAFRIDDFVSKIDVSSL